MKKIFYILSVLSITFMTTACEVDNYDAPDAGINGTVTDETTGKGLVTEQPNGFRFYYKEIDEKYPNAQFRDVWAKPDGTFANTQMFAAKYEVYVGDGAFPPSARQTVTIGHGEQKTVNFTVKPYVSINEFKVTKVDNNTVSITFKFTKNSDSIQDYRIFATNKTKFPGANFPDNVGGNAVALKESDLDAADSYTETVTKSGFDLATGSTYWFRLGVRCKLASGRYNFSDIQEIQF